MNLDYNKFDLSHEVKSTGIGGPLYPLLIQEVLPGDIFKIREENLTRAMPMIAPLMHRVNRYTYYFFVQNDNIWEDAHEFYTRGRDGDSTVIVPRLVITNTDKGLLALGELSDHMGIPPTDGKTLTGNHYLNALPFRAYQSVWNEMFRNNEVIDELDIPTTSGDTSTGATLTMLLQLRNRMKDKTYYNMGKVQAVLNPDLYGFVQAELKDTEDEVYRSISELETYLGATPVNGDIKSSSGDLNDVSSVGINVRNLELDSSDGTFGFGFSIESLRRQSALMRWIESLVRGGYRYPEYLKTTWKVKPLDGRLGRPEYLGGTTSPLRISEVLNTSATATEPQGEMAGHGMSNTNKFVVNKQFHEHGWIIGLECFAHKPVVYDGIESFWHKYAHDDYANPYLADLGAQYMRTSEVYYDWDDSYTTNLANFAYMPRYQEYKMREDRICGDFRDSLDFWHMGSSLPARPSLNEGWVTQTHNTNPFASSDDAYLSQTYLNISVLRKLPVYANLKID